MGQVYSYERNSWESLGFQSRGHRTPTFFSSACNISAVSDQVRNTGNGQVGNKPNRNLLFAVTFKGKQTLLVGSCVLTRLHKFWLKIYVFPVSGCLGDSLWRKLTSGQPEQPGKQEIIYRQRSRAVGFFVLWFAITAATVGKNEPRVAGPAITSQICSAS